VEWCEVGAGARHGAARRNVQWQAALRYIHFTPRRLAYTCVDEELNGDNATVDPHFQPTVVTARFAAVLSRFARKMRAARAHKRRSALREEGGTAEGIRHVSSSAREEK